MYTFDDVLNMATTGVSLAFELRCVSSREDLGIFPQGVRSIVWSNGEHGRETELQLLASHSG